MRFKRKLKNVVDWFHLSPVARKARKERLTYLSPMRLRSIESEIQRIRTDRVEGEIIEFGVALGGSAVVLASNARDDGRNFHGLDVFEMIPPPTSNLDDEKSKARYAKIAAGKSKGIGKDTYYGYRDDLYGDVCKSFAKFGLPVGGNGVWLYKGLFEDTWPAVENMLSKVSLAHIDCDWYEPVHYCLNAISPLMSPGGSIILDDYESYGGCRTATDAFLAGHPEYRSTRRASHIVLTRT